MIRHHSRRDFVLATAKSVALTTAVASTFSKSVCAASAKPLKIGQIGVGHSHAKGKISVLRASSDWEVVGLVEPDPNLRRQAEQSRAYQGIRWMTEEELLNHPGLQAVVIETRYEKSLDIASRCVGADKHVHLDKPPGANMEQFRRLLGAADRRNLTIQMGYMYRYNPGVVLLREFLDKGWLGEIFEVDAVMSKQVGEGKRKRWSDQPGGTMFELGCHLVDLIVGILGAPDRITSYSRHSGSMDDALSDNMLAVFEYPRATAAIRSTAVEVEGGERRHLTVCGTEGTLHIQPLDDPTVRLALSKPVGGYRKGYQTIQCVKYERYVDDLADLARIVRREKKSDFPSSHDLATQRALLEACGIED